MFKINNKNTRTTSDGVNVNIAVSWNGLNY